MTKRQDAMNPVRYCVSNGPGRLLALGRADSQGSAGEIFDGFVFRKDGKLRKDADDVCRLKDGPDGTFHRSMGVWSMTTMPA